MITHNYGSQYSPVMTIMQQAVRKASKKLARDFGEVEYLQVSKKGPRDFVTKSDLASEKILYEELSKARPGYSFLTEERGAIPGEDSYRWIIDPLDGTFNFMHANPFFAISLALEKFTDKNKSEIIAAVIDSPATGETFWAEKGKGAWLEKYGSDTGAHRMRLRIASRKELDESLLGLSGGVEYWSKENQEPLWHTIHKTGSVRLTGSTALTMAYLAAGRYDAFIQCSEKPWDIAAGILLVQEAGGIVSDFAGSSNMLASGTIVAANSILHKEIIDIIGKTLAK